MSILTDLAAVADKAARIANRQTPGWTPAVGAVDASELERIAQQEQQARERVAAALQTHDAVFGGMDTLVACQRLGRAGTGIELDPDYFDIACRRVDEATRQPDMFITPPPPAPTQEQSI